MQRSQYERVSEAPRVGASIRSEVFRTSRAGRVWIGARLIQLAGFIRGFPAGLANLAGASCLGPLAPGCARSLRIDWSRVAMLRRIVREGLVEYHDICSAGAVATSSRVVRSMAMSMVRSRVRPRRTCSTEHGKRAWTRAWRAVALDCRPSGRATACEILYAAPVARQEPPHVTE